MKPSKAQRVIHSRWQRIINGFTVSNCLIYNTSIAHYKYLLLIFPQRDLIKIGASLKTMFAILKFFVEDNKLKAPGMLAFLQT